MCCVCVCFREMICLLFQMRTTYSSGDLCLYQQGSGDQVTPSIYKVPAVGNMEPIH